MREEIHKYVYTNLLNNEVQIDDDTPLYTTSLITSMGHLKLINFIERTFDVSIPMSSLNLENFDTIKQIVQFIEGVQGNSD
ncbi:MAG: acyl carrier protein [Clostridia bacterium]|nr:acyl carrier protein [Clostridia bacterium]